MKSHVFSSLIGVFICMLAFAENTNDSSAVFFLKSGERLNVEQIRYRKPLFAQPRFILNGGEKTIMASELDSTHLWGAKFVSTRFRGRWLVLRRVISGPITMYDHIRPPQNERLAQLYKAELLQSYPLMIRNEEGSTSELKWFRHRRFMNWIEDHPPALDAFQEARSIRRITSIGAWSSVGLLVGGAIIYAGTNVYNNPAQNTRRENAGNALMLTGLLTTFATDIYWIASSQRYLDGIYDAVLIYNQKSEYKPKTPRK